MSATQPAPTATRTRRRARRTAFTRRRSESGTLEAATCVDCHGAHDVQQPDVPRQRISLTCGKCHGAIFDQYRTSVHGAALLVESNPDVPTCIDCHGVHNISDPTTALFRVRSPELCAKCHADAAVDGQVQHHDQRLRQLSDRFSRHDGRAVRAGRPERSDQQGGLLRLSRRPRHRAGRCQQQPGDPGKSARRPAASVIPARPPTSRMAWVGHFPPTLESQPLLFVVNTFYTILIPVVVAGFIFLVLTDIFRRVRRRGASTHGVRRIRSSWNNRWISQHRRAAAANNTSASSRRSAWSTSFCWSPSPGWR